MSDAKHQEILGLINERADAIVDDCLGLVVRNSENPPGDTLEIVDFASGILKRFGIPFEIVAPVPNKPNIVARLEGAGPGPNLVFNGHLDTFPIGETDQWTVNPLGEIRDDRLYGRGSADMKGGLTASLAAFIALSQTRDQWNGSAKLTMVSDEETGAVWGSQYLLKHFPDLKGDAIINGEPSSPGVAFFGEKGARWYEFTCRTLGGHGAYAFHRPSATTILMQALLELKEAIESLPVELPADVRAAIRAAQPKYDAARDTGASDAVEVFSCNVGNFRGGHSINMIAESATAQTCIRLPPGAPMKLVEDTVARVMEPYSDSVSMETLKSIEATLSAVDSPVLTRMVESASLVTGEQVLPAVSLGGTDVRFWRKKGVDSAVYGPTHHNMASPDEFILIPELLNAARAQGLAAYRYLTEVEVG